MPGFGLGGAAIHPWWRRRQAGDTGGGGGGTTYPVININSTVQATSQLKVGWVHTNHESTSSLTTSRQTILAASSYAQAQHLQGFGTGALWPSFAGAKDWSGLDRVFGYPAKSNGYMKDASVRVLYALSCPAFMRVPKSGSWNMPIGQGSTTNEFDYKPPHYSWFPEFGDLVAEAVVRYGVDIVVWWNELKGWFRNDGVNAWYMVAGTAEGGKSTDPAGSGFVDFYNVGYAKVKAARPATLMYGPYPVLNTQAWEFPSDWADDAEPDVTDRLQGHAPSMWGYADKKALKAVKQWLKYANAADGFAFDLRNSTKDYIASSGETGTYTAAKWDTNPDSGTHPTFWLTDPWSAWQKEADIMTWFRSLGATSPSLYGRTGIDSRTLPVMMTEWYPNAKVNDVVTNPNTGTPYPDPVSSDAEKNTVAAEGLRRAALAGYDYVFHWRLEGDANGHGNPISLWDSSGVATGLAPIDQAFKDNFGPGTQLLTPQNVPTGLTALASATKVLVINKTNTASTFIVSGTTYTVGAYSTLLITR